MYAHGIITEMKTTTEIVSKTKVYIIYDLFMRKNYWLFEMLTFTHNLKQQETYNSDTFIILPKTFWENEDTIQHENETRTREREKERVNPRAYLPLVKFLLSGWITWHIKARVSTGSGINVTRVFSKYSKLARRLLCACYLNVEGLALPCLEMLTGNCWMPCCSTIAWTYLW